MRRWLVLLCVLSTAAWTVDGPVPFVPSVKGNFASEGFVGFYSTPARIASPGFALGYFESAGEDVDEFSWMGAGDIGNERWRLAFLGSFHGLDSLYRQTYSELEASASFGWLTLGSAYGFSLEWIPGGSKWARQRCKAGVLARWMEFSVGAVTYAFAGESVEFGGGIHWNPKGHFSLFVEGDAHGVRVGNNLMFEHGGIDMLYGFPNFSFSLMVNFYLRGWFTGSTLESGSVPLLGLFFGKKLAK